MSATWESLRLRRAKSAGGIGFQSRVLRPAASVPTFSGMRREITWVEKLPERVKREVRVHFHGGKLYWKEKFSNEEGWNEEMVPSEEDWEQLLDEVQRRFQRRKARQEDLDLVMKRAVGVRRGKPSQHFGKEL